MMIRSPVTRHQPPVKPFTLCLLSGLLLSLPFFNGGLWIFAWFGFVPLFFALKNKSKGKAFLLSYLTGVIFWSITIYWLVHVTLLGTIVLILYLALYFGVFGLIISTIGYRLSTIDPVLIPSIWVLLEYIRSRLFTGFPWALLGYSQYQNLPIIQIADITGAWGVSFLVMLVNVAIYLVPSPQSPVPSRIKKYLLPVILCVVVTLFYGYYKLYKPRTTNHEPRIKISVIQGNIPQELKWDSRAKDYIVDKYLNISWQAIKDNPDLIIWPEAALPFVLEEEPVYFERIKDWVKENKISLLLGAVTSRENFYYNSAILTSGEGRTFTRYDKLHLVPFGEYIPLKKALPFLETIVPIGDIAAGKEYTVFTQYARRNTQNTVNFSVLICFEDLFPELSRRFVNKGAQFLINITNDAWYKRTAAAHQHLQASIFRAVENRVFLARCANTGVSGFIAPGGKVISLVQDKKGKDIFIDGFRTQEINTPKKSFTLYTRYGEGFIVFCFLFVLFNSIISFGRRKTLR